MLGQYSMHINDDQKILCNVFKISVCWMPTHDMVDFPFILF